MTAHVIWTLSALPRAASALQSSISALERDIAALDSQSSGLEPWLGWFTLVVAIGVALEILVVIHDHRKEVNEWRVSELIPEGPSLTKLGIEILSIILIIVGVMGEFGVGLKISSINGQLRAKGAELRSKSDQLLALVTSEARDAKTSAELAETAARGATTSASNALGLATRARREAASFAKDILSAKTQAAEAESHIADAVQRAAAAEREIAKLKTPRHLSEEQLERIKSKIKLFPGTPFDLFVSFDSDSTALMESIDATLRSAGWMFNETGTTVKYGQKAGAVAASGVSIHVAKEHTDEWGAAVFALVDALVTEGIPTDAFADTADAEKGKKRDRIHVIIGSKPLD